MQSAKELVETALQLAFEEGKQSALDMCIVGTAYGLVDKQGNLFKDINNKTIVSSDLCVVRSARLLNDRFGSLGLRVAELKISL